MDRQKLKELSQNLVSNRQDYMSAFRKNIFMYLSEKDITIKSLSEDADLPMETLKNFLYGNSKDCMLSTAVKLATALNVSVDELIGAETMEQDFKQNCGICRNLPSNSMYLINWLIRYQNSIYNQKLSNKTRYISVIRAVYQPDGNLRSDGHYSKIDISSLPENIKSKVFLALNIECWRYMPKYSPFDVLLIANDREPSLLESVVVLYGNNIHLVKRVFKNKTWEFVSISDKNIIFDRSEVEQIGYVADSINCSDIGYEVNMNVIIDGLED